MSEEAKTDDGTHLKRVPVIVRSWDGPNSRLGLEVDLAQMPWGPFDALGKRLSLLLPVQPNDSGEGTFPESQIERALRHVEHAADRCAEFAQLANGNQELWLRSQETWEWIRKYLTTLWVDSDVEGRGRPDLTGGEPSEVQAERDTPKLPRLPGAASTLEVAARALRATPLSAWRETVGSSDMEAPTREEAVQTLLGIARVLGGEEESTVSSGGPNSSAESMSEKEDPPPPREEPAAEPPEDPDQVSFDFAMGYDQGYQMGRKVGLALGGKARPRRPPSGS